MLKFHNRTNVLSATRDYGSEIASLEILIRRSAETHFLMKVFSIILANRIALSLFLGSCIISFRAPPSILRRRFSTNKLCNLGRQTLEFITRGETGSPLISSSILQIERTVVFSFSINMIQDAGEMSSYVAIDQRRIPTYFVPFFYRTNRLRQIDAWLSLSKELITSWSWRTDARLFQRNCYFLTTFATTGNSVTQVAVMETYRCAVSVIASIRGCNLPTFLFTRVVEILCQCRI